MDGDHIAGLRDKDIGVAEHFLSRRAGIENEVRWLGSLAAECAPRPEAAAIAVTKGDAGIWREDLEFQDGGEATAPAAGAPGIGQEPVTQEAHGHLGLVDLDRRVLEV